MRFNIEKWEYPTEEEGGDHNLVDSKTMPNEEQALALVKDWLDQGFAVRWYRIH